MSAFDYERLREDVRAHPHAYERANWPVARLIALIDGHEAGRSFRDIARQDLNNAVTRNACIGKAARIGLPARGAGSAWANDRASKTVRALRAVKRASAPPRPPRPPKPIRELSRREAAKLEGTAPVLISALTKHQCKWPVGDPKAADFAFCGRLKPEEGPYCPAHAALAIDPARTKAARRKKTERLAELNIVSGGVVKRAA